MAKTAAILIFVSLVLALSPAWAASTIYGSTGLIRMPSADVLGQSNFTFGLNLLRNNHRAYAKFGVIPQLEMGFTYFTRHPKFTPHVKYQFLSEEEHVPALSFGLINDYDIYVVASKQLGDPRLRGHAGLGEDGLGLMLGVSYLLNPVRIQTRGYAAPVTTFVGEYVDEKFNLGLRFKFDEAVEVTLASLNLDQLTIGISLSHSF